MICSGLGPDPTWRLVRKERHRGMAKAEKPAAAPVKSGGPAKGTAPGKGKAQAAPKAVPVEKAAPVRARSTGAVPPRDRKSVV